MIARALIFLISAGVVAAGGIVEIEPLGESGRTGGRVPLAVVGGRPVEYDLAVEAPSGQPVSLLADVRQVAGKIAAPLQTGLPLRTVDFSGGGRRIVSVEIPMPAVRLPSEIEVVFRASGEKGGARVRFAVYPESVPGEAATFLADAEKRGESRLAVFGESPGLRAFFEAERIDFVDLGSGLPVDLRAGLLALGEVDASALENWESGGEGLRAIFFVSGSDLMPGIYRTESPGSAITKVTLPLLPEQGGDPRARHLFLDLLSRNLDPTPHNRP